ncbi:MAG: hypothetical protein AB1330_02620 [Bacillota bacterium]
MSLSQMSNLPYWAYFIQEVILPRVRCLREVYNRRILSAFEGLEEEARRIREKEWERLISQPADPEGDTDLSDLAEAAQEVATSHYISLKEIQQGIINLSTVHIYHLFEQELLFIFRNEALPHPPSDPKLPEVVNWFKSSGIELESFRSWPNLDELRLVANVVKHADGPSANKLRSLRPDMFVPPEDDFLRKLPPPTCVFRPLVGEDLYVTTDEINLYFGAVEDFWRELIDKLKIL